MRWIDRLFHRLSSLLACDRRSLHGLPALALTVGLLALGSAGLSGIAQAQSKYDNVQIKTINLNGGLYMLQGAGGNIGVSVGDDGILVVDTQHAPLSEKIFAAIKAISDQPIRYVINTHWHHDHTGGNENFAAAGAVIVAHENLRTRLMSDQQLKAWNLTFPAMPEPALPKITYDQELVLHFNDNAVRLIHPPLAHTDGDSIVFFPAANVLHMGDTLATGRFPFIDRGALGSIRGLIAAYELAISLTNEQTQVIPGHGELTDRRAPNRRARHAQTQPSCCDPTDGWRQIQKRCGGGEAARRNRQNLGEFVDDGRFFYRDHLRH